MNKIMTSWEGQPISRAIDQWGYPSLAMDTESGKTYVWEHQKSSYIPTYTTITTTGVSGYPTTQNVSTGGYTVSGNCTRVLKTDDEEIVRSWEWYGDNCPFAEIAEYKNWRNSPDKKE
jgi:hypothetical protein